MPLLSVVRVSCIVFCALSKCVFFLKKINLAKMFVIQLLGVALSLVFTNTEGKGPFDLRQGLRGK